MKPTTRTFALATSLTVLALAGCAMQPGADPREPVPATSTVASPALSPDRQTDRPRSFSDPGPMYPDTGR